MHSCILNLTIAIGTFLNYMENGTVEGGYFTSELEWAWRDWRPVYGCEDKTSVSYLLNRVMRGMYEPAIVRNLTCTPFTSWRVQ